MICDMNGPRCYLIGAGTFGDGFVPPAEGDIVIACDGGVISCAGRGIRPDIIVGDFDSLGYIPEGQNVITLPVRKDITDLWAGYEEGVRRGFRLFMIYGAAGGTRPSHTAANVQLLTHMAKSGCRGILFGEGACCLVIHDGEVRLDTDGFGHVSVFSLSDRSEGVRIAGLSYVLDDAVLTGDFPLGVGNLPETGTAVIAVKKGTLLVVLETE